MLLIQYNAVVGRAFMEFLYLGSKVIGLLHELNHKLLKVFKICNQVRPNVFRTQLGIFTALDLTSKLSHRSHTHYGCYVLRVIGEL